jgi:hypothetical protein
MEWYDQYSVHIRHMDRQQNDRRGLERVFSELENYIRRLGCR